MIKDVRIIMVVTIVRALMVTRNPQAILIVAWLSMVYFVCFVTFSESFRISHL